MYLMIDSGMRGGVCLISKRYAKANNKALGPLYAAPTKPSTFIIYMVANNLYGWEMSQILPIGEFTSVSRDIDIDWSQYEDDLRYGFIVECDLAYPPGLHDTHNDDPLAAERVNIQIEMTTDN